MMLGAEFLAMLLIVVYVGAVAVLFLFVVMMLDVDFAEFRQGFLNYLPIGALIGLIFLSNCCWWSAPGSSTRRSSHAGRADPGQHDQHRGARPGALHAVHLLLPGGRPRAAGGHDRRHRADPARACRHQAPGRHPAERPHQGDRHGCEAGAFARRHAEETV
jgi:hypothetical protein